MRTAGVLLPMSSLPGPFGIGTLGAEARNFIDFLAAAGQTYWQLLPIGPTGYGDSPYQSFSAFASNPYFIDPELLCAAGYLLKAEVDEHSWGEDAAQVDYGELYRKRHLLLKKAAERLDPSNRDFLTFCQQAGHWLDDYALFMALKEEYNQVSWYAWPPAVRLREPFALSDARKRLGASLHYWRAVQYFFQCQWVELKQYAGEKGVHIIGDIPIYVSADSSDVWASPELFQVDDEGKPTQVSGCPPDSFSAKGQLWGNPLYDWDYHHTTRYEWWCRRLAHACTVYDVVRIDHFRGFESYYSIPASDKTAENGSWRKGPGLDFIKAVRKKLPDANIIAEDLGFLTPAVNELLEASSYPGMKVLQFAFDSREEGDYLPHNYLRNQVVYTGTHDNTTTAAWALDAPKQDVATARRYLNCPEGPLVDAFVRCALSSVCNTAIIPLQDWLGLGAEARMNVPSQPEGNWQWRVQKNQFTAQLCARVRQLSELYGRVAAK